MVGWVGGWVGEWVNGWFLQRILPLCGSILQAGTCLILCFAKNPRWSWVWQYFLDSEIPQCWICNLLLWNIQKSTSGGSDDSHFDSVVHSDYSLTWSSPTSNVVIFIKKKEWRLPILIRSTCLPVHLAAVASIRQLLLLKKFVPYCRETQVALWSWNMLYRVPHAKSQQDKSPRWVLLTD